MTAGHQGEAALLLRTEQKSTAETTDPTRITYQDLAKAYDFFNCRLFGAKLPPCLITMQRRRGTFGYFAGGRFRTADGKDVTDEIALNPSHFHHLSTADILSVLVHEQTHLEQHHFGKPGRSGYHNKEWVCLMEAVGLIPSDTGRPGGQQTGTHVSHYVAPDGPFERACRDLVNQGFSIRYVELWSNEISWPEGDANGGWGKREEDKRRKKAASKTRYRCPVPTCLCRAGAKPATSLICGLCHVPLTATVSG
jgi:predicted SprT family Zn-dependent metalloprotease